MLWLYGVCTAGDAVCIEARRRYYNMEFTVGVQSYISVRVNKWAVCAQICDRDEARCPPA